jgi:CDP-glucose 4,6-dehydratase
MNNLPDPNFWHEKRVFLTGHTGFKGSWLCLWLQSLGAYVQGFALEPSTKKNLFTEASVNMGMIGSKIADIRDLEAIESTMRDFKPEIVIHLAAQPLVRLSYNDPIETITTNVMGTAHLLDASRRIGSVKAFLNVTTDKCYENREWVWSYRETEPLGGHDLYSASKACSEIITSAYRRSFLESKGIAVATARAGNVIGGGDFAEDRLIPDILRALEKSKPIKIRNSMAIRPWQHVLEPLSGYLILLEKLFTEGFSWAEPWNFGPHDSDAKPVSWIVNKMIENWGKGGTWKNDKAHNPHESSFLKLDISKAKKYLNWIPQWTLNEALERILAWHIAWNENRNMHEYCLAEIKEYASMEVIK